MPNPANIRETRTALGFKKQAAPHTINGVGEYFSTTKINAALNDIKYTTESDAKDIGKDFEFAQTNFRTSIDVTGTIEKILSSQFAAWAFAFGLGKAVAGGGGYTITLLDNVADGIDLPEFTFVESIRQGASAVLDRAAVGCVINELTFALKSGPGRQNAMLTAGIIGTGWVVEPSGVALPDLTPEEFLNAGGAAILINGVNYVTEKSFVSFDLQIRNNVRGDTGYYPGSGVRDGFQVRGRMEQGDREHNMTLVARYMNGSTELQALKDLTEGTVEITVTGAVGHSIKVLYHRVTFMTASVQDDAGIVTINLGILPMIDPDLGVVTVTSVTDFAGIVT